MRLAWSQAQIQVRTGQMSMGGTVPFSQDPHTPRHAALCSTPGLSFAAGFSARCRVQVILVAHVPDACHPWKPLSGRASA